MAETDSKHAAGEQGRRKEVVGEVVSNRMQKTIVVEVVTRKKSHPFYVRVVLETRSFTRTMRRMKPTSATSCGWKRRGRCRS